MTLKLQGICKAFDGRRIIDQMSFAFPQTGVFAIVGKSGEGKTTLLRLIAGLLDADEGEIEGNERVAFVFQEYRLFEHLCMLDNLTHILFKKPKLGEPYAKDMLRALGLPDDTHRLYPRQLSGGMKQRVSLARAFLSDASVLLLDEPLKELDQSCKDIVTQKIREQGERRLVIVSVHEQEDAARYGATVLTLTRNSE